MFSHIFKVGNGNNQYSKKNPTKRPGGGNFKPKPEDSGKMTLPQTAAKDLEGAAEAVSSRTAKLLPGKEVKSTKAGLSVQAKDSKDLELVSARVGAALGASGFWQAPAVSGAKYEDGVTVYNHKTLGSATVTAPPAGSTLKLVFSSPKAVAKFDAPLSVGELRQQQIAAIFQPPKD